MNYKELNGISIREGFLKFHIENPEVYSAFKEQALKAIARGRTKLSAKLIINWIRWNTFIEDSKEYFKINDAFAAYYARLFTSQYPKYIGMFNFRKLRNEESAPYMKVGANGQLEFF